VNANIVSLNGRFITQARTGVQRYAWEMVKALDALPTAHDYEFELLLPRGHSTKVEALSNVRIREVGTWQGNAWEQLDLPRLARGRVVSLCNTYPVFARRPLVVIHDAAVYAYPQGYTHTFVAYYRFLYRLAAFRKDVSVVTDSDFSVRELQRFAGIPPARLNRIYCGADHWRAVVSDESVLDRLELRNKPYLVAVASHNKNKNLPRLIEAFGRLQREELWLVLIGGGNRSVFAQSESLSGRHILQTGYLSDAELGALYSGAKGLVFPSLYEGFGLPPIEAMHAGCPVVCSDAASLPEVGGDAVLYCDGHSTSSIAEAIRKLLDTPGLSEQLVSRGYVQARRFTWERAARELLQKLSEPL